MTYLSCELGSDSRENSSRRCEEGCGWSNGLAHTQVLPP